MEGVNASLHSRVSGRRIGGNSRRSANAAFAASLWIMPQTVDRLLTTQISVADLSGLVVRQRESVSVSLQVQIMLVLSGHPGGRATLAAMNADLKVLAGAGAGWSQRIKRLAANAPGLDIFTEGYVVRDAAGWQITEAGRRALQRMDAAPSAAVADQPPAAAPAKPAIALVATGVPPAPKTSGAVIKLADRRRLPRRAV